MAISSDESNEYLCDMPSPIDWERHEGCEPLTKSGTIREGCFLLDWACEVRFDRDVDEDLARKISEEVSRKLAEEMSRMREEFEDLFALKRRLDAGEVLIVPCEQMEIPDFPESEKDMCKSIILKELEESGELFPSDIAEKYDLDFDLVLKCVAELKRNDTIIEAQ